MSKITPKNEKAKTKSAHSKQFAVYVLSFFVIFLAVIVALVAVPRKAEEAKNPNPLCLKIAQKCFDLEIADEARVQAKGLSDRDSLAEDKGMLFAFDRAEEQCFWMKDMRFNLDMIWLNEEKTVIKTMQDVSPDTYPDQFCADNAKYVLEFTSGFADKYGLKPGTKLQFE